MKRKKRPEVLKGKTSKVKTSCGNLYLTMNDMDGQLGEIGIRLGKSGNCIRSMLEIIATLYSIILQSEGIPKEECIEMFQKHCTDTSCGNTFFYQGKQYKSCLDYIGRTCIEELKSEGK